MKFLGTIRTKEEADRLAAKVRGPLFVRVSANVLADLVGVAYVRPDGGTVTMVGVDIWLTEEGEYEGTPLFSLVTTGPPFA